MREKKIKLLYVVNARIPNNKAHSIQIVHTCQALGSYVDDFTLITPKFVGKKVPLTEQYAISQSFSHIVHPHTIYSPALCRNLLLLSVDRF